MAEPTIPPPPPGFTLDAPQQPDWGSIPPPPAGFTIDGTAQVTAPDNRSTLGKVGDWVSAAPGRFGGAVSRTLAGAKASDLYEVPWTIAKGVAHAASDAVQLPGDVLAGREDPMSRKGIERAFDLAGFASPAPAAARANLARSPVLTPLERDAADAGISLTAAQRTGNPALHAAEDALAGGARGPQAQNVAQAARAAQEAEVRAARDAIGERVGTYGDESKVRLDRPADAGGIVGQRISEVAGQAEARIAAQNAALQAERDALFRGAQSASDSAAARFNPQGFQPVEAGGNLAAEMARRADASKKGYQQAYRDTFAKEGEVAPEFFTGVNKPGSQGLMAQGSPLNEFAAPISTRVKESLLNRAEPIIPDATLTPLASRTLDELDRVANLRLGRIGNPRPGDEVAGVNLRGVEQARKIITARINSAKANPHGAEDLRALRGIAKSFDDELEKAFDSVLFRGDETALASMKEARGAFAKHQHDFKQRARGDDAGATIQKIVERNATPEEVSNYILGSSRVGDNGLSVRLFDRLKETLGQESPQFQQIRGAAWEKLTSNIDAATPAGAQKLAQNLAEFTAGRGSTLAKRMFSADELSAMQRYSSALQSFSAMAKSKVHQVEAEGAIKTLIDVANKRLSPEDMASSLFGYGNKVSSAHIRLVDAVGDIIGRNGPEWAAIRQANWQRLTDVADGKMEMGAQKMSQRLHEFLNGEGKTLAERLYSPQELSEMRRFAAIQRARVPPPGTTNPSNSGNRMAGLAQQAFSGIMTMLGASQGGWAGAAVGMGAGKVSEGVAGLRAASQARKLFAGEEPAGLMTKVVPDMRAQDIGRRLTVPTAIEVFTGKREIRGQR